MTGRAPIKHGFTWPTEHRPPLSLACHDRTHGGCTGYAEPYDTHMCGCRCHDPVTTAHNQHEETS